MKLETLKRIKSQLVSLYKLIDTIAKERKDLPGYMVVSVFLQNAQFNAQFNAFFNLEEEENQLYSIQRVLKLFTEYDKDSFYEFVYKEYTAILEGNVMSEEVESPDESNLYRVSDSQI